MYHNWDWPGAEREFRSAIALNPGHATAHQWYGNFLSIMGRPEESLAEFSLAVSLDPLSSLKLAALGWSYYFMRNYDKAIDECRRALELDADLVVAQCWLAQALEAKGDYEAALAAHEEGARQSRRSPWTLGFLGHGYVSVGRVADAHRVRDELLELRGRRYVSGYDIAIIYIALGDADAALTWLEQAERDRAHQMAFLKVEPRLDPLRSCPASSASWTGWASGRPK